MCNVVHEERCGPQQEQQQEQDCLVVEQKKCSLVQEEKCETQYSQAHGADTPALLSQYHPNIVTVASVSAGWCHLCVARPRARTGSRSAAV